MRPVVIESPYAGKGIWPLSVIRRWLNVRYARACLRDSLLRGEAPIASHLLYTQPGVLRDHVPEECTWGINAGFAWALRLPADGLRVFYMDRGISHGMKIAEEEAKCLDQECEYRWIRGGPSRTLSGMPAGIIRET